MWSTLFCSQLEKLYVSAVHLPSCLKDFECPVCFSRAAAQAGCGHCGLLPFSFNYVVCSPHWMSSIHSLQNFDQGMKPWLLYVGSLQLYRGALFQTTSKTEDVCKQPSISTVCMPAIITWNTSALQLLVEWNTGARNQWQRHWCRAPTEATVEGISLSQQSCFTH